MNVLAINCGSSTLKFQLLQMKDARAERQLGAGGVDRIGGRAVVECSAGQRQFREEREVADHRDATGLVFDWLAENGLDRAAGLDAVGHRVVHGGARFSALLDSDVLSAIDALGELAPLHNAPSLKAIEACRAALQGDVPMVATFDTAFHRTLPDRASHYAISTELAARHGVYRYGVHGLAHRSMMERYAELTGTAVEELRLITLQLGAGCSATAIDAGRPIDTSMGFTPLEGPVTRSSSMAVTPQPSRGPSSRRRSACTPPPQ